MNPQFISRIQCREVNRVKKIDSVDISPVADQKIETADGETLLKAVWSVPVIAGTSKISARLNSHYQAARRFLARYTDDVLIRQAKRQKAFYDKYSFPFLPHEMNSSYEVTLNESGILSLFTDRYEYAGGANGFTIRRGDTWSLESGFPLHIDLNKHKRALLRLAEEQALRRQERGEAVYNEPLRRNLRRYWKPDQWYLTRDGLALYYGQVTIAPHPEGIPVFVLPRERLYEVKRLKALCRKIKMP